MNDSYDEEFRIGADVSCGRDRYGWLHPASWAAYAASESDRVAICTGDRVHHLTPDAASRLGRSLIKSAQDVAARKHPLQEDET